LGTSPGDLLLGVVGSDRATAGTFDVAEPVRSLLRSAWAREDARACSDVGRHPSGCRPRVTAGMSRIRQLSTRFGWLGLSTDAGPDSDFTRQVYEPSDAPPEYELQFERLTAAPRLLEPLTT
jgi:hypothetical protein